MDRAGEIAAVRDHAREVLDAKHRAREITLGACRLAIQSCAAAIRAVQREEFERAEELIAEAGAHLARADGAVAEHPDVRHGGYLHDAKKEFAEAISPLRSCAATGYRRPAPSGWRFPRTSTGWPKLRVSCADTSRQSIQTW